MNHRCGTKVRGLCLFAIGVAACGSNSAGVHVALPDGNRGIGFDDLRYSPSLKRVLAPGGRTGRLDLVDPETLSVQSIGGFGSVGNYSGGHDDGPTSVDEGDGLLFVTDRTTGLLDVVDPVSGHITASVALASGPDYVRFVASTHELWVTEPGAEQIEVFAVGANAAIAPVHVAAIAVKNGPESLVIDGKRRRAYTHRWQATTVSIAVDSRAIVEEWQNGCASSRGIAVDEMRGFLIAACSEGTTSVLDVQHGGTLLSTLARGSGYDVIGYNPSLGHIYLAGSSCNCLITLGISAAGTLSYLGRADASGGTHCATADDRGHSWWCDQDGGSIWRVPDNHAATF